MMLKQKQRYQWRRLLHSLWLIILFSIVACSPTANNKTASLSTSGFGGTGYQPSSGFGGTGIVGTITQFGSIWVNGIEVDYNKNTQITSKLLAKDTLKLGQQVVLETLPLADKTITNKIHIYYPLAGKITRISKRSITLNQHYHVKTTNALIDKGVTLKKGEFVAINGFTDATQSWVATRINQNTEHKHFYQPNPTLHFSTFVKQVVIESTGEQLKQWQAIRVDTTRYKSHARLMLMGKFKNNHIHIDSIKSFARHSKGFSKRGGRHKKGSNRGNGREFGNRGKANNNHEGGGYGNNHGGNSRGDQGSNESSGNENGGSHSGGHGNGGHGNRGGGNHGGKGK